MKTAPSHAAEAIHWLRQHRRDKAQRRPLWTYLPFLRNAARKALLKEWRPGYLQADSGDFFYLPTPVDASVFSMILKPYRYPSILQASCRPGDFVIDVGANLGAWAVPMARFVGTEGQVVAFEPIPHIADAARRTFAINRLDHVTLVEAAVCDQVGTASFTIDWDHTGGSHLGGSGPGNLTVKTLTLDSYFAEVGLPRRPSLIKVDVEGHELAVLRGARQLLADHGPRLILETGHEERAERAAIRAELEPLGYVVTGIDLGTAIAVGSWDDYELRQGSFAMSGHRNLVVDRPR